MINQVIDNKAEILRTCEAVLDECNNIRPLTAEYYALHTEAEIIAGHMQQHISLNAHTVVDQVEYQRQYDDYETRFAAAHQRINCINEQREALIAKRARIQNYLATLNSQNLVTEFDEALWYGTVDQIRVTPDGQLRFLLKGGTEIQTEL